MPQTLAIFDLDNTLLGGDSDHAWGEFLITQKLVNAEQHRATNDGFYADYLNGDLDINAYLRFVLQFVAGKKPTELAALHRQFMAQQIDAMMLQKSVHLLAKHRSEGDYLLIITATNDFITAPIAKKLGVDALLASTAEIVNGRYTGQPTGTPCYHEGKVVRLQQWLGDKIFNLDKAFFYSDSHNDIPLLNAVGNPYAVDPDDRLREYAHTQRWPIISLRD
jgi:HAD superfamily hydrolase (TIGR01490 family)